MRREELQSLTERYPVLCGVCDEIEDAYLCMHSAFKDGNALYVAGNGGSAADADHISGELRKAFRMKRSIDLDFAHDLFHVDRQIGMKLASKLQKGLPCIPLTGNDALSTAVSNDVDGDLVFAQKLYGLGHAGDVFLGISTSGNSKNILYAMIVAKALKMKTICLTGRDGGELVKYADISVIVPEKETFLIQELHVPVYHTWCLMLEDDFFGGISCA